jgi:hypothetical protein
MGEIDNDFEVEIMMRNDIVIEVGCNIYVIMYTCGFGMCSRHVTLIKV